MPEQMTLDLLGANRTAPPLEAVSSSDAGASSDQERRSPEPPRLQPASRAGKLASLSTRGRVRRGSVRITTDDRSNDSDAEVTSSVGHPLPRTVMECLDRLTAAGTIGAPELDVCRQRIALIARIAKAQMDDLPADPLALRPILARTLPSATRAPAKPLLQARATLADLLMHAGWVSPITRRTTPMRAVWGRLLAQAAMQTSIKLLPPFARYCDAQGVAPDEVRSEHFARFEAVLERHSLEPHPRVIALATVKRWHALQRALPFWPQVTVVMPKRIVGQSGDWRDAPGRGTPGPEAGRSVALKLGSYRILVGGAPEAPAHEATDAVVRPSGSDRPCTLSACLDWVETHGAISDAVRKRQAGAVTAVARLTGRASCDLPADPATLRPLLRDVLPTAHKMTHKRWSNIRSDLKGLLVATGWVSPLSARTAPISGPWAELLVAAGAEHAVKALPPFARFCAARDVLPHGVVASDLEAYETFLVSDTLDPQPRTTVSQIARAWNRLARVATCWSRTTLALQSRRARKSAELDALLPSFRQDLDVYLAALRDPDPLDPQASQPLAARTLKAVRASILRAVAVLIAAGEAPEAFVRLADVVAPDRLRTVLLALHREAGGQWTSQTVHLAYNLVAMARRWVKLPTDVLQELERLRRPVKVRYTGLSRRAQDILSQFSSDDQRQALFELPDRAFEQAEMLLREGKVQKAAKLHETALALALVLHGRPVRADNLHKIDLARHLRRDPRARPVEFAFAPAEVKNRRATRIALDRPLSERLERHIAAFRPHLPGASGSTVLFQGLNGGVRSEGTITKQINKLVQQQIGARFRLHDARNLAVDMLLEDHPNNMATAQQLLGHSSDRVTEAIYFVRRGRAAQAAYAQAVSRTLARSSPEKEQGDGRRSKVGRGKQRRTAEKDCGR
jgi:integrase